MISGAAFGVLSGKKEGELYTYLQVSENGTALYGFSSLEEKEMFLKLVSVSGVGPLLRYIPCNAILIISSISVAPRDFARAIAFSLSARGFRARTLIRRARIR